MNSWTMDWLVGPMAPVIAGLWPYGTDPQLEWQYDVIEALSEETVVGGVDVSGPVVVKGIEAWSRWNPETHRYEPSDPPEAGTLIYKDVLGIEAWSGLPATPVTDPDRLSDPEPSVFCPRCYTGDYEMEHTCGK